MYVPYACDIKPIMESYNLIGASITKLVSRFLKFIAGGLRTAMVKAKFSKLSWNA
jgi:hypothetical protein